MQAATLNKLQLALEADGLLFLGADGGGGPGVRFKA
jgi:hypothetical protein